MDLSYKLTTNIYKISVIDGNHGYWLFVCLNGQTIWEQSGYKHISKAIEDGQTYARFYEEKYANDTLPKNDWKPIRVKID